MLLALSPLLPIPITITNEPGLFSQALPFLTTLFGIFLGLAAEPWKAWFLERRAAKNLKPVLYRELAWALMDIAEACVDKESYRTMIEWPPQFSAMAWYSTNSFNLTLRADPKRAIWDIERVILTYMKSAGMNLSAMVNDAVELECQMGELDREMLDRFKRELLEEREKRIPIRKKILGS